VLIAQAHVSAWVCVCVSLYISRGVRQCYCCYIVSERAHTYTHTHTHTHTHAHTYIHTRTVSAHTMQTGCFLQCVAIYDTYLQTYDRVFHGMAAINAKCTPYIYIYIRNIYNIYIYGSDQCQWYTWYTLILVERRMCMTHTHMHTHAHIRAGC
jgi:hypothetical protein